MLRGLFPRLFSHFREGGLIVGQFTVSNSGATLTPTANCYSGLTMAAGTGTGQYVLTLAGGARRLVVVAAHCSTFDEDDNVTDGRFITVNQEDGGVVASSGLVYLTSVNMAGTVDEAALPDTAIVTITLIADK